MLSAKDQIIQVQEKGDGEHLRDKSEAVTVFTQG